MATENIKYAVNTFSGGMDADSSDDSIAGSKYRAAKNFRIGVGTSSDENLLKLVLGGKSCGKTSGGDGVILWSGQIGDWLVYIIKRINTNTKNGEWVIRRIHKDDMNADSDRPFIDVFGPCTVKIWDDYNRPTFTCTTSDETDNNKKLYIATGEDPVWIINIMYEYKSGLIDAIKTSANFSAEPLLFVDYIVGSMPCGYVLYAYSLVTDNGAMSLTSPFSKRICIFGTSDQNVHGNQNTGLGVSMNVQLSDTSDAYTKAYIYKIITGKTETAALAYLLKQPVKITKSETDKSVYFLDVGNESDWEQVLLGLTYRVNTIIPKTIESKNNMLFAANVRTTTLGDLNSENDLFKSWDSRAYRFGNDKKCTLTDIHNTDTRVITATINKGVVTLTGANDIPKDYDCYDDYNNVNLNEDGVQKYMYDSETGYWVYGGMGINVSWEFVVTKIMGTTDVGKITRETAFINMMPNNDNFVGTKNGKNCIRVITSNGSRIAIDNLFPTINSYNDFGTTYKNPKIATQLKSLRRGELYRYGIILYDKYGNRSLVKWIADIRVPSSNEPGFNTFEFDELLGVLWFYPIGIRFKVRNLPKDCTKYEIVRCNVSDSNKRSISQCIILRPIANTTCSTFNDRPNSNYNIYFSPGPFTTGPFMNSSLDACGIFTTLINRKQYFDMSDDPSGILNPTTTYFGKQLYNEGNASSKYDILINMDQDNGYFDPNADWAKRSESHNYNNFNLFCAASPEICMSEDDLSLKSLLQSINGIETLLYVWGHGSMTVNIGRLNDSGELYEKDLKIPGADGSESSLLPYGLCYNVKRAKNGCYTMIQTPATMAGANYGYLREGEYNLIHAYRDEKDGGWNHFGLRFKDGLYNIGIPLRYKSGAANVQSYAHTTSLKWIHDGGYNNSTAEKLASESDEFVASSMAYNKLTHWSRTVTMQSFDSDKTLESRSYCRYNINKASIVFPTVYNWSYVGLENEGAVVEGTNGDYDRWVKRAKKDASSLAQAVGSKLYANYVFSGTGMVHIPEYAIRNRDDEDKLIRSTLLIPTFQYYEHGFTFGRPYSNIWPNKYEIVGRTPTGYAGKCMAFEITDLSESPSTNGVYFKNGVIANTYRSEEMRSIQGTFICNLTKESDLYGGLYTDARSASVYCSQGNVFDSKDEWNVVFDGNCYIMPFEYTSMYKSPCLKYNLGQLTHNINYMVPIETEYNLYAMNGYVLSEQAHKLLSNINVSTSNAFMNAIKQLSQIQYKTSSIDRAPNYVRNQEKDLYSILSIFRQDVQTNLAEGENLLNVESVCEYNRIYYSRPKDKGELVDSWAQFDPDRYIDVDDKFGQITHMRTFNDKLLFWQERAFGNLPVNERAQISNDPSKPISVGTSGVIDTYDYFSLFYGMREGDHCEARSSSRLYWWDSNKKALMVYYNGQISDLTVACNINSIINSGTSKKKPVMTFDPRYSELMVSVIDEIDGNLVYSEIGNAFTSVYGVDYDNAIYMTDSLYMFKNNTIYKWSEGDPLSPAKVEFVVNDQPLITKVFDNGEICGNLSDNNIENVTIKFSTPLEQNSSIHKGEGITNRENNRQFAIPRDNDANYGNRLRGKTMKCEITFDGKDKDFKLSQMITKYRKSY